LAKVHPAAGRAPQITGVTGKGVDQKQAVFVQENRAGGKADGHKV